MMVSMVLPLFHGVFFVWVPWYLRSKRDSMSLKYKPYFTFLKWFDTFTRVFKIRIFSWVFYFQPSILCVWILHMGACVGFIFAQTTEINYQPHMYIISKRIGRICIGNLPMLLLFVAKNTLVSSLSGLTLDKSIFFHKWLGRLMLLLAIAHLILGAKYWLDLGFIIMLQIPPQIFGFIAFGCLAMLNIGSLKVIRNFAFDLFLVQHRVFNFIMLLLAFFHSPGNRAAVIIGVHVLVLDRVVSRVLGILHKRKGPTKGISDFEVLDDTTIRISIPIEILDSDNHKWWWCFVPRYGNWRAGQYIQLNVLKVAFFQYHPFTISSLSDSGKMVIVMKVHKGFTRKLKLKLQKLKEKRDEEEAEADGTSLESQPSAIANGNGNISVHSNDSEHLDSQSLSSEPRPRPASLDSRSENSVNSISELMKKKTDEVVTYSSTIQDFKDLVSSFTAPEILTMKAGINGPYGGDYQPLTRFDSVVLFSAGSGASFTLPVALDLLKTIKEREEVDDYLYRPKHTSITIVLVMRKLANLQWYDHLWEEFLPFLNAGRAHLAVHITQEVPDASEAADNMNVEQDDDEKRMLSYTGGTADRRTHSYASSSSGAYSLDTPGFSVTYSRPDFESIIADSVKSVCCSQYRKSIAVLGCGPEMFNGLIKIECNKNRWVTGAPDIYCYTESFG